MNDPLTKAHEINWVDLGIKFEEASTEEILKYALQNLSEEGSIVFLTAFGPEGCVLMAILAQLINDNEIDPKSFTIANLDTGYQFKETLELKERLEEKYHFKIEMIHPKLSVQEQDEKYGKDLFSSKPDDCCFMRKLVPLQALLDDKVAWITSIRREETSHRANAKTFEYDKKFKLGKINPLVKWTKSDIWKYIHENKVTYNPLLDTGYSSIGCEPCTSMGADRKGSRWAGKDKIECGLHINDDEAQQGGEFVI